MGDGVVRACAYVLTRFSYMARSESLTSLPISEGTPPVKALRCSMRYLISVRFVSRPAGSDPERRFSRR